MNLAVAWAALHNPLLAIHRLQKPLCEDGPRAQRERFGPQVCWFGSFINQAMPRLGMVA